MPQLLQGAPPGAANAFTADSTATGSGQIPHVIPGAVVAGGFVAINDFNAAGITLRVQQPPRAESVFAFELTAGTAIPYEIAVENSGRRLFIEYRNRTALLLTDYGIKRVTDGQLHDDYLTPVTSLPANARRSETTDLLPSGTYALVFNYVGPGAPSDPLIAVVTLFGA